MRNGVKSKDLSDFGTGPTATPVSRDPPADETKPQAHTPIILTGQFQESGIEVTRRVRFPTVEEDETTEAEIEREYQGRLAAIWRLPKSQRAGARRAAREWRHMMLKALREKCRRERQGRYEVWKQQTPRPS